MQLKLRRVAAEVKGIELAAELGVSPSWVSVVESRRSVPAEHAARYRAGLAAILERRKAEDVA